MPRVIPLNKIDEGIMKSVENSLELAKASLRLSGNGEKNIPIILYIYAVEEFGKAILLKQKKDDTIKKGLSEIIDDIGIFSDHDTKIDEAKKVLKSRFTKLQLLDVTKASSSTDSIQWVSLDELLSTDEFLSEKDRVSLLLVDYDIKKGKWINVEDLPLGVTLRTGCADFIKEVTDWKNAL